jgi:hypothetical protein
MDYRELKSSYDQNLSQWKKYEKQAQRIVETVHREFLYYLGIREEDRLLGIVPFSLDEILGRTEHQLADCLVIGDEGQVGAAFRLVIGEDAYILRFEMSRDNTCWILKALGESEEYALPENAGKDEKDELYQFFEFLTTALSAWISEELDSRSTGKKHKPQAIDFIVNEKLIKIQFATPKAPTESFPI